MGSSRYQSYGWNGEKWSLVGITCSTEKDSFEQARSILSVNDKNSEIDGPLAKHWKEKPILTIKVDCSACINASDCQGKCTGRFRPDETKGVLHEHRVRYQNNT